MREVSVQQVPADAQLVDVREISEFDEVHADTAVNIPLGQLADSAELLDTTKDIYVICQSGGRSAKAVELLAEQGIEAINVAGGTRAWVEAGLPTG